MSRLHRLSLAITLAVIPAAAQITFSAPSATLTAGFQTVVYGPVAFTATGGTGPYTYAVTGLNPLPGGLTLSSAGSLSGTPTASGTFTFTVTATDSTVPTPQTGSQGFSLTINPAPTITTASLPATSVGATYNQTLTTTPGTGALTFSISVGALPPNLGINTTTGAITGTVTLPTGTSNFTVRVTDTAGATGTRALSIQVNPAPTITTASLPASTQGIAYSGTISATGGIAPLTLSAPSGLPTGLLLNSNGTFSGTATAAGTFPFTATVTDAVGASGSQSLSITINPPPTISTATALPNGLTGAAYSQTITATGGTGSLSFAATGLPTGLSIAPPTGIISGIPAVSGPFNPQVTATDSLGVVGTKGFTLTVIAAPSITTPTALPPATVGVAYSQPLNATGGTPPFTWAATGLPAGLSIALTTGVISGTPTASGAFTPQVTATDSASVAANKSFTLNVVAAPTITTATDLPSGTVGTAYSQPLAVTGGTPPFTWAAAGLPSGLSIVPSTGIISGTPTTAGAFTPQVTATDSVTAVATKTFNLTIAAPPAISSLSPSSISAGAPAFNLTVSGSGFVSASTVQWAGTPLSTTFVSATQLTAAVPAILLVNPGSFNITVLNPGPVTSAPATFTVGAAPSITAINPIATTAGAPIFTLTVTGAGFNATSVIRFGGQALVTTFLSPNQLSTLITPTMIPTATTISITVANAGPVVSNAAPLLINAQTQFVTSTLTPALIGVPYSQAISISGGTPPFQFAFTNGNFPPGLSLNPANGAITGTPSTAGTYDFAIQVTDAAGYVVTRVFNLIVARSLSISTEANLPTGAVGLAYSVQLAATGGAPPYSNWQVTTGALPPGITLNAATGLLSGTPTATGSYAFIIQVRDSAAQTANKGFTLIVNAGLSISTTSQPPTGIIGTAFQFALAAAGGTQPYTWSVVTGTLPAGLTLNAANGAITGTPTTAGTSTVTIEVKDAPGQTARAPYTFEIISGLAITNPTALPTATARVTYTNTFQASGGTGPYSSWRIVSGAVPAALVLNSLTGELSGTPTNPGDYSFTIAVNDATTRTVSKAFTLTVLPPGLAITSAATLPAATFGAPYSFTLQADGGATPYRWVLGSGTLPAGLTLANNGVISGTPTVIGSSAFNITVLDSASRSSSRDFTLVVNAPALSAFTLSGPADTIDPSAQQRIGLDLSASYPSPLSGTVVITFIADTVNAPSGASEDPALQFANGSRSIRFTIPAGSTAAQFEGTPAFQSGTLAGTIVLTSSFSTGSTPVPNVTAPRTIRILRAAPTVRSATVTRTANGFDVTVTGFSTPREVTQALFRFTPSSGANLQTTELTLPLTTPAAAWFSGDASRPFGSQFNYRQSFTLAGESNAIASISVTLSNSTGASQPVSANVP